MSGHDYGRHTRQLDDRIAVDDGVATGAAVDLAVRVRAHRRTSAASRASSRDARSGSAGTSLELTPAADNLGIWVLGRDIVSVEPALAVACLRLEDFDVLVTHEQADLNPLEDKSCRWAEGKEKEPEDNRTPRVLG